MNENDQPTLNGLGFELDQPDGARSPLRAAVRSVIDSLNAQGLLEPWHAAHCQLALELADSIGRSRGRASAAAMASAQLMQCLEQLPQPATATAGAKFEQWLDRELGLKVTE